MDKLKHIDKDGNTLEFLANDPVLLSHSDLLESKKLGQCTLKFRIKKNEAIFNGKTISKDDVFSIPTTPEEDFKIYAVTFGGWLPLPFVNDSVVLADKNIIENMRNLTNNPSNKELQSQAWWLSLSQNPTIAFNPILYAFEDYRQRMPSYAEFRQSIKEASSIMLAYYDRLHLVRFNNEGYEATYSILQMLSVEMENKIKFLTQIVPLVVKQVADHELSVVEQEIDQCVKKNNINENSLVRYLALGCIYELDDGSGNIHAKNVLKPKEKYTEQNAYNTVMDLTHLEALISSHQVSGIKKMFFCTGDYHLAALWISLNPHNFTVHNGRIDYEVDTSRLLAKKFNNGG